MNLHECQEIPVPSYNHDQSNSMRQKDIPPNTSVLKENPTSSWFAFLHYTEKQASSDRKIWLIIYLTINWKVTLTQTYEIIFWKLYGSIIKNTSSTRNSHAPQNHIHYNRSRYLQTCSLSLIKNEKQSELHLILLILSSEVGNENKLIQQLGLVYAEATAELLKKWGFYSIWFSQENADNWLGKSCFMSFV